MLYSLKNIVKQILYRERASSEKYIEYLKKKGVQIGEDCKIYSPRGCYIDVQYPWMISIGSHVRITHGVIILTHDFSWSVLKKLSGELCRKESGAILGASGAVNIGDNVFIGINTVITRGVTIGNNVVIGAGSVVTKNCPSNGVYAGNPAHFIMGIGEFYAKREKLQIQEAKELAIGYKKRYGKFPPKEIFNEYFMLFETCEDARNVEAFSRQMELCDNIEDTLAYMKSKPYKFYNYDEFMKFCFEDIN